MNRLSFRVKIIATLVIGIIIYSVVAFTIYSISLKNKLLSNIEDNIEHINLLRDQYYFSIRQHDGTIIRPILKNMENNKDVLKTYLVNSKSKVIYPDNYRSLLKDTESFGNLYSQNKDISIKTYHTDTTTFNRVFIRMQNTPSCYSCHNPAQKTLGLIILDLSNRGTDKIVSYTWKFSFFYTIFLLAGIFALVAYLHFRYIRSSLRHFRSTINLINLGKFEMRLAIPEVNELGSLGKNFNEMLDTFERTQNQLSVYHQKELQNSQKLATIGEMSARIAHEIRNPITGIARAMEIIIADLKEDSNKPILEEIQRQANRVEQAISNLLKYSRSKDLVLHEGDINEVIKSLVFFLKHQAHEKNIRFAMELSDNIPTTLFDYELLENVLLNLSFNAIKAISEQGMITYKTSFDTEKKMIIIAVKDSGAGIPREIGNEIFKPFYTTHTKGTGLGLAISKDIIEKHKGEIWYENNMITGCTFFISLPAFPGNTLKMG
ncbi:MAG: ATP-binding protein [Bacteroidetes bacterium]|nr:ATP-binding protein [Bacteroidota bacterium]